MSWSTNGGNSWSAPSSDPDQCDPTFQVCADNSQPKDAPASDPTPAPANATPAANATANVTANATESASALMWGLVSAAQLGVGYATYNNYNTFVTSIYSGRTDLQKADTGYTTSWLKTVNPLAMWFYTAYATMGMQGVSVFAWLLKMAGVNGLFMNLFKLGMLYPFVQLGMLGYTYYLYPACSGVNNNSDWVSTCTTCYNSCTTYSSSYSTNIPTETGNDAYMTYMGALGGGATLLLITNQMSSSKFSAAASNSTAPADADSKAASPAPADSSAAPADSSSSAAPADSSSSSAAPAEPSNAQPTPAPEPTPEPEPEPANNGGWNGGWGSL